MSVSLHQLRAKLLDNTSLTEAFLEEREPSCFLGKVAPFSRKGDQPTALQQAFTEWRCISAEPQGKERGWTCCPKDWKRFQKGCYYISDDKMSWAESVQNCTGMGSHLVVINSKAEQVFLSIFLQASSRGPNFYIGLRAEKVGEWHWVDQTPFNVSAAFWRKGEPSNTVDEKCVVIHTNSAPAYNWNDVRCENHHRICEAAAVTV
ncbi:C-type lectin domain family 4 member D-like [Athene noctua]|uniref:C-type lectin domain family 4 member D-like n=1 Tax=Athene noctua TaxID=126797 RepID=UPI003EB8E6D7